ncbi:MAG: hypothetical protein ACD_43C00166G0002 [uncultured bacterium]|nr:MAG: hypothetical protein ACD_43C00166G0002 [uncultured bacterium]
MTITKKKKQILDFIQNFQLANGYYPTLEEIRKKIGVNSLSTVHQHLSELEDLGMLERHYGEARHMKMTDTLTESHGINLPIVGFIAAGYPIEAIEDRTSTITVPKNMVRDKTAYVLKVKGDSMIESLIADGDYVVVEKQDYASNGDIVVALLEDGTATLKEFHREKNYVRLQPRNVNYKPITARNVVIQGKVLGIIRKFQ